jgi:glycosyltransferase involved in cell wall biosynthesis
MSELRVALVGPFPPPYGGMAAYFSALEAGLAAEGVDCERIEVEHGSLPARLASFARAAVRIRRSPSCVFHCITGSQANLLANGVLLLASGGRSVLSIVGGDFHGAAAAGTGLRRRLMRAVVSRAGRIVACNAEIEEALRLLGLPAESVIVLSNALPLRLVDPYEHPDGRFERFASHRRPLLVSVSGWYEHYGSMDLLRAVADLRDRHPSLGLALVVKEGGDAAFMSAVHAWIDEQGLGDHVVVLTNVPSVPALMSRSDVFVRTPHVEGDSISVREALAAGVPVVASDAGFRPDGVILYRPADPADLAAKLDGVLSSPSSDVTSDLRDEGEANLRRLIETYREVARVDPA